jgi:bacillolysin
MLARSARTVVLIAFVCAVSSNAVHAAPKNDNAREEAAKALNALRSAAGDDVRVRLDRQGVAAFVEAAPGKTMPVPGPPAANARDRATAFVRGYARLFGLRSDADVVVTHARERDHSGMERVRLQQVVNGVPVTGTSVTVHMRDDKVVRVFSKTAPDADLVDTHSELAPSSAIRSATALLAKSYGSTEGVTFSEPRLEILHKNILDARDGHAPRLAWFIEARHEGVREFIWIDARRGATLLHFNQIAHARNRSIYDAQHLNTNGALIRTEGGPATGDADVDNAYTFSGNTYDYFFTEHGRDSYNGLGAALLSTVNYCSGGCPYQNAFWNGSRMIYGDGYTVDDVTAHELTHAVTEYSANLYYYMQSGALNESYSDIFGETVDLLNGAGSDAPSQRWLLGEDLPGGAIRNMSNPNQFYEPGRMSDPYFSCDLNPQFDGGGVHSNSGIPNHAFTLMVDGGTYNGETITGIGLTKAGKIQYRALTTYLDQASNFSDNYNALLSSCADLTGLYGITTSDCAQVRKALDAVEMNGEWECNSGSNVPAPPLCAAGGAFDVAVHDLENILSSAWTTTIVSGINHWNDGSGTAGLYWAEFPKSGNWSFWGFGYDWDARSVVRMTTPLAVTSGMRMQFAHSYSFENTYDGGFIEYSTNGGSTWADAGSLIAAGRTYPSSVLFNSALRPGFTGDSYGYTATQLNLSSLAGQSVLFRFYISTDDTVSDYGWFVDDVRFYRCDTVPTNVVATATSATSVSVAWTGTGASSYRVYRSSNGTSYSLVGSPATNAFTDTSVTPNTAYLYKVRTFTGTESPDSNVDLATTVVFTDSVLTTSTKIHNLHFVELLTAINAVRALGGLSPRTFTSPLPAPSVGIRQAHLQGLRDALYPALSALHLALPAYTDATLTAGATGVKKVHIDELRAGVR